MWSCPLIPFLLSHLFKFRNIKNYKKLNILFSTSDWSKMLQSSASSSLKTEETGKEGKMHDEDSTMEGWVGR